jgi:hypothetical protein
MFVWQTSNALVPSYVDSKKNRGSMKRFKAFAAALLLVSVSFFVSAGSVASAATSNGNGMKVSPVRADTVIKPGESKTLSVFVQNVTSGEENLQVIVNDFVAKDESGAPSLLLNGKTNARYGLKRYVTVPKTVTIPAGQQREVKVTVAIPAGVAGGGYFGAVRFAPASEGAAADKNVSLSGSVGSLILVSVPGKVTENLQVASFDARKNDNASKLFTSGKGVTATIRFRNSGNVQEQPFGKVLLKKGDKTLGQYEINDTTPKGNILPDSIRKFNVDLKNVGSFGKYTLEGNFGYGTSGQLVSAKTSFYVIPVYAIVAGVVLLLLVILIPVLLKRYKARILRSSGRR